MNAPAAAWATPRAIQILRAEWIKGTSTPEIARLLGITKNALVGWVHRHGEMTARPSPIKRTVTKEAKPATPPPLPLPTGAATLPALASVALIEAFRMPPVPDAPRQTIAALVPRPAPIPPSHPERRASARCCWPIGMPRTTAFRFCGDPTDQGPFCADHRKLAFVKIRDRREAEPEHALMGGD